MFIRCIIIAATIIWVISIIVMGSVPPVSLDALSHHLLIPKLFLQAGGIVDIPALIGSYYPMNVDFLYLIPLSLGRDYVSKYIHFGFGLLIALSIYIYLKNRLNHLYALIGFLLFLTLPITVKLSITAYVDLGFGFFSIAALLMLIKWVTAKFRFKYLLLSAISCGLCLGTKYNGLLVLLLLTLFVPFLHSRYADSTAAKGGFLKPAFSGVIFLGAALLVFSPWMIRNYKYTANPLFPMFGNFFLFESKLTGDYRNAQDMRVAMAKEAMEGTANTKNPFAIRRMAYNESMLEAMLVPLRIFFQGKDNDPRYFDGRLNPYLLFLPLMAIFIYPGKTKQWAVEKRIMLTFSVLYLIIAFFKADMRIRYIMPAIPPLVILSVFGIYQSFAYVREFTPEKRHAFYTSVLIGSIALLLVQNGRYLYDQFRDVQPLAYLRGQTSRDEYISKRRPEYLSIQWANKNIPSNSKIMCLFLGRRGYYFENEVLFSKNIFGEYLKQTDSNRQFAEKLRSLKITHLLVRNDLFIQWLRLNFDSRLLQRVSMFFKENTEKLFEQAGYSLYRID